MMEVRFESLTVRGEDELGTYEILKVPCEIYPLPIILKAAYWFTDRVYLQIRRSASKQDCFEVLFRSKDLQSSASLKQIVGDFCNSLIDQSIREIISAETHDIQSVIVKRAFAEALSPEESRLTERLNG